MIGFHFLPLKAGDDAENMIEVSIIICTRNRCDSLRATLDALAADDSLNDARTEVIVVDNGSSDETASVVGRAFLKGPAVRYIQEPAPGLSNARNCGVGHALGAVIVFVDDDVRPFPRSVQSLIGPILAGEADATVGRIEMAPDLKRPWITMEHSAWLACNAEFMATPGAATHTHLVGAFMAFSREVLKLVPGFDPAIGPPAANGDDTLFSMQLQQANYQIVYVSEAVAEHHFHPGRLSRKSFRQLARICAASDWYIQHHWRHEAAKGTFRSVLRAWLRIQYYRLKRWREWTTHEAMPAWEKIMFQDLYLSWFSWLHRHTPRNYDPLGLMRRPSRRSMSNCRTRQESK